MLRQGGGSSASSLLLLLALLTLWCPRCEGNIHLDISQDTRRVIDLGTFAFTSNGVFQLSLKDFVVYPDAMAKAPNFHSLGHIGFVLDPVSSAHSARVEKNNANDDTASTHVCFILDPEIMPKDRSTRHLYPLDLSAAEPVKTFTTDIKAAGLYALFFYNCKGFDQNGTMLTRVPVSFTADAIMYNVDRDGTRNYLSNGMTSLPYWYTVFFFAFGALSWLWLKQLRDNPLHTQHIHRIMLAVVSLKSISLLLEALMLFHYARSGTASVWDLFYYVVLGVKGVLLFSVLLLLGSGWSIVKAFLSDSDKKVLMVLVPCQVLVDIAIALINETSEGRKGWGTWVMLLNGLDLFCCCCVLLPIVWSINSLYGATANDDKAQRTLARLRQFRSFYLVVIGYIYFTRIAVVMIEELVTFENIWVAKVLRELVAVAFYTYGGLKFLPSKDIFSEHLGDEDRSELEIRKEVGEDGEGETA